MKESTVLTTNLMDNLPDNNVLNCHFRLYAVSGWAGLSVLLVNS